MCEKIRERDEELPHSWPIQGTTGYDFLNYLNGIFCDSRNEEEFNQIYTQFTGRDASLREIDYSSRKLVIESLFNGEARALLYLLKRIICQRGLSINVAFDSLEKILKEIVALFPVYRTYIDGSPCPRDCAYIKEALSEARKRNPGFEKELDFYENLLLPRFEPDMSLEERRDRIRFVMRFQQLTAAVMAKGFEDTALYRYPRLLSLNEVGGVPVEFGTSLDKFHELNKRRALQWPLSMNATSTHDTKRGEDVRARINVLSEMPSLWRRVLFRWRAMNEHRKRVLRGKPIPNPNEEYFFYQTLLGALPFSEDDYGGFVERIKGYMIKALREAKENSSWLHPNQLYEEALVSFIDEVLRPGDENEFLKDLIPIQREISHYAVFNSLSQTLLKITAPGVPDFYQGTELWDLNLVDPDNRRPVDFEKRKKMLGDIIEREKENLYELIEELLCSREDGRVKLFLIYKALRARREKTRLFEKGEYVPIQTVGGLKHCVIAFARIERSNREWAITIAPRFTASLVKPGEYPLGTEVWEETYIHLPDGFPSLWRDWITERRIEGERRLSVGDVIKYSPAALLISERWK